MIFSKDSPLSDWPKFHGLSHYDEGNYLSVLYLAWAYIISARWVELLRRSTNHECHMTYNTHVWENPLPKSDNHSMVEIDIGDDICDEEVLWWRAVLCSENGWDAITRYNGHVFLSPWSVSAKESRFALVTKASVAARSDTPSSAIALNFLSRFCAYHRLYAQCSVALAGVLYIPFLRGKTISLPLPRPTSRSELRQRVHNSPVSIPHLLTEHEKLLPEYMTLSSNIMGLRSLLCSTFFNPLVQCNLVSAWLNPAFAIINSIVPESELATFPTNRKPSIGILWLGAILTYQAKSVLRDTRMGMMALDLPASAWARTTQTFLTCKMGPSMNESICRDDECRLSFIAACEGHDRPPVCPWKPFGETILCDTDLMVRKHAECTHCLEYESWEWVLSNGLSVKDSWDNHKNPPDQPMHPPSNTYPTLGDYTYDFFSQLLSEGATRGIFEWLRSTGYPRCERPLYQHSWIHPEESDDEELNDEEISAQNTRDVASWLRGIE